MNKLAMLMCTTFLIFACSKSEDNSKQKGGKSAAQQGAKPVSVIELSGQQISLGKSLPARVEPVSIAEIRPQVDGIIQAISFEQGSYVEEGKQLYQIDPVKYELALKSAQASLENALAGAELASANKTRFQSLLKTNAVSQQEYDRAKAQEAQAQAAVSLAEAEIESAKVNLAYTKVYAPIAGYIGPLTATEGALVTAQQATALAVIRKLDPVYVDITQSAVEAVQLYPSLIDQEDTQNSAFIVRLSIGQSETEYEYEGKLVATDLAVEETTGTITIRAQFPNPDGLLLPGTFARATIQDTSVASRILVPQKAVTIEAEGSMSVWLVDKDEKAVKQAVEASTTYDNNWVIEKGLAQGDLVIVEGAMMLKENTVVKPQIVKQDSLNKASTSESKA